MAKKKKPAGYFWITRGNASTRQHALTHRSLARDGGTWWIRKVQRRYAHEEGAQLHCVFGKSPEMVWTLHAGGKFADLKAEAAEAEAEGGTTYNTAVDDLSAPVGIAQEGGTHTTPVDDLSNVDHTESAQAPAPLYDEYRKAYPEVKVYDGITYVGILAKPGMPYVLLLGEHHPITCTDNSRLISKPAVMHELLKDGDHFLLESPPISHENLANGYGTNNRMNLLRTELQPCLRAEWVKGKYLYARGSPSGTMHGSRRQGLVSCKYHTAQKNVHFHWLDYGMFSELSNNIRRTQVIRCRYLDLEKLKSVPEYKGAAITMIQNSLVHSLLDNEKPPCWKMRQEECYRNADSAGGTCVWDSKGLESQNAFSWSSVIRLRPKCRSMYDYVHNQLHKPKCSQFQMPESGELAKWFVNMLISRMDGHKTPNEATLQNFYMRRFVMDFYTLLRMFREFTKPAKRCIVYAGTSHSKRLAALLRDTQGYQMLHVDNRTFTMKKEPCRSITI